MQEISCAVGGQPTDGGELLKMIVAADTGNREMIQKEKRNSLLTIGLEDRLALITLDGRMTFGTIRMWLLKIF